MKYGWTKWIDVLVLAATVGVAVTVAVTGAGTGSRSAERAVERTNEGVAKVDRSLAADRYRELPAAKNLDGIDGLARLIKAEWSPKREERRFKEIAAYHPGTLDDLRSGREIELRLLAPSAPTAVAEAGSITLHWSSNERTTANIVSYVVYRAEAGVAGAPDGPESAMATVPAESTTYVDTAVHSGKSYVYRVSAKTEEPSLVRADQAESPKSEAIRQRAARDFEIRLLKADEKKKTLRFLVRRLVREVWYEKEFDGAVGEAVGAVDPGSTVDYGTGCKVVEISTSSETTNDVREDVVFAADGTVVVVDGKVQRKTVQVPKDVVSLVCVLTNEWGEREELRCAR